VREAAFSKLTIVQSKSQRSLKNIDDVLRPAFSCINPRMDDLCKNHHANPSH